MNEISAFCDGSYPTNCRPVIGPAWSDEPTFDPDNGSHYWPQPRPVTGLITRFMFCLRLLLHCLSATFFCHRLIESHSPSRFCPLFSCLFLVFLCFCISFLISIIQAPYPAESYIHRWSRLCAIDHILSTARESGQNRPLRLDATFEAIGLIKKEESDWNQDFPRSLLYRQTFSSETPWRITTALKLWFVSSLATRSFLSPLHAVLCRFDRTSHSALLFFLLFVSFSLACW